MPITQAETSGHDTAGHLAVEATRDNFAETVLASPLPVLVDFWGPRCIPCMELLPVVEDLAATYQGRLRVAKVNVPQNRRLCAEQRVAVIPAFLFFKEGREVFRLGEETTADQLSDAVKRFVEGGA